MDQLKARIQGTSYKRSKYFPKEEFTEAFDWCQQEIREGAISACIMDEWGIVWSSRTGMNLTRR